MRGHQFDYDDHDLWPDAKETPRLNSFWVSGTLIAIRQGDPWLDRQNRQYAGHWIVWVFCFDKPRTPHTKQTGATAFPFRVMAPLMDKFILEHDGYIPKPGDYIAIRGSFTRSSFQRQADMIHVRPLTTKEEKDIPAPLSFTDGHLRLPVSLQEAVKSDRAFLDADLGFEEEDEDGEEDG